MTETGPPEPIRLYAFGSGWGVPFETAAPFLIGMAAGWLIVQAWKTPVTWRTGIGVALATVAIGMPVRNLLFGEGTAFAFVVVATLFVSLLVVGWRAVAMTLGRRSARLA